VSPDARQLLILRHAKSAWDTGAPSDYERPLARRGERDAPRVGGWIRRSRLAPDLVVSSPAERARQTTELLADELGLDGDAIRWDDRVYGAGVPALLEVLADQALTAPRRVLLVGHNPGLEELVEHLTGDDVPVSDGRKPFPTAALACVALPDDWSDLDAGSGTLLDLIRPRSLA